MCGFCPTEIVVSMDVDGSIRKARKWLLGGFVTNGCRWFSKNAKFEERGPLSSLIFSQMVKNVPEIMIMQKSENRQKWS